MWESTMTDILFNIAPVVLFMGIAIWYLVKRYERLEDHAKQNEKENLETLKDLTNLLSGFITKTDKDKEEIVYKVTDQAENVKNHIDKRIDVLEAKQKDK